PPAVQSCRQGCSPVTLSPVLSIEKDQVNTDTGRIFSLVQSSGDFQKHSHAACAVIGAIHGAVGIFLVFIGEGACIPVGSQQNAFFLVGVKCGNNVLESNAVIIEGGLIELLNGHLCPKVPEAPD